MLLWISCSVFDCPLLSRAEAMLGTPPSYQLLVVGGCQAHQPQLSAPYTREVWTAMARCSKKARRSRTPSRPAFCRNGTSLAGHSDSANKPRFALTRVCRDRKSTRLNSSHGYISYAV